MPVFIELTTDPFTTLFTNRVKGASPGGAGLPSARRPLRGLEIKDETYAYIKLIRADGTEVELFDSSDPSGMSTSYSNFLLTQVQDQRMERHQIVETFGDTYLFLFGESPRFLQVTATLINSFDFNWRAEFLQNYDTYLRGTKAIEQSARCYLFYDDNIVEGYILNCQVMDSGNDPMNIPLQFQFFVTNYSNISIINGDFPTRSSANVPDGVNLTNSLNGEQVQLLLQQGGAEQSAFGQTVVRTAPIRGKIADNTDEYTTAAAATFQDIVNGQLDQGDAPLLPQESGDVDDLPVSMGQSMQDFGVDPEAAFDPFTMDDLGIGVTFLPFGVGVGAGTGQSGARATFGASSPGGFSVGGFAGVGVGIGAQAQTGFTGFGGAFVGVGASAGAGASQGAKYAAGAQPFGAMPSSTASSPYASQQQWVGGVGGLTNPAFGQAAAYASASKKALQPSPTGAAIAAAAQAGGYSGANAYLGSDGGVSFAGASYAGQSGAGASVFVGGKTTAFSLSSVPGTLTGAPTMPASSLTC